MRLGIAITRAGSIEATWTTVHLARAALARGWSVRFIEPWDFEVDRRGAPLARSYAFDGPPPTAVDLAEQLAGRTAPRRFVDLAGLDLLFVMTHLACADEPMHPRNAIQAGRFDAICARYKDSGLSV